MTAGREKDLVQCSTDQKMIDQIRSGWAMPAYTLQQQAVFDDRLKRKIEAGREWKPFPAWLVALGIAGVIALILSVGYQYSGGLDSSSGPDIQSDLVAETQPDGWIDWMDAVFEPQDEQMLVARLGLEYQALDEVLSTYLVKK